MVDTDYEKTAANAKCGTATPVDVTTSQVAQKAALPQINMSNPHHIWTGLA